MMQTARNFVPEEKRTKLVCTEAEGRTQQQFRDEADINVLVARFGLTGKLPENFRAPAYGDFSEVVDFASALEALSKAEGAFMSMPGPLRARFENDPQRLMEFLADERNREEAQKLGLLREAPVKVRDVVQAVDELAAKLTAKPAT
ncbi:scaffold protein [Microviridae sp.]|nr:scaffold protein [Microviridae sp.]